MRQHLKRRQANAVLEGGLQEKPKTQWADHRAFLNRHHPLHHRLHTVQHTCAERLSFNGEEKTCFCMICLTNVVFIHVGETNNQSLQALLNEGRAFAIVAAVYTV